METMKINEPLEISRQDIENYVKMKLYTELTLIKEKLALFEKKYNCDFPHFEKSITEAKEEDFERWDDYMEWKAFYNKYNRLKKKEKKSTARKLDFKIDESLEDVIPFSDIEDSAQFAKKLREDHWK